MDALSEFLSVSSGWGSGDGDGWGSGSGWGWGSGDGRGLDSGWGYGTGWGSGYGDGMGEGLGRGLGWGEGSGLGCGEGTGDGMGLKSINGKSIYIIDHVETVIDRIRGSVAKGGIINGDLTITPCYIVKQGDTFAHGESLHKAMDALRDKLFEGMPEEERIAEFVKEHEWGKEYPDSDFYDWHHRLTGSCEMGRQQFAIERGLEKLNGKRTVEEFIALCENSYGGEVIKKLRAAYDIKTAKDREG